MHGSIDKSPQDERNIYRSWSVKLLAFPVLLVVALIGFAVSHPGASKWISESVQAEFVGTDLVPDVAPPTRLAQPANEIRRVNAH